MANFQGILWSISKPALRHPLDLTWLVSPSSSILMSPLMATRKTISELKVSKGLTGQTEDQPSSSQGVSREDLLDAIFGLVTAQALTTEANGLIDEVYGRVLVHDAEGRKRPGGSRQDKLRQAVAALLGDLLLNHPKLTFIQTDSSEFTGQVVSHRSFMAAERALSTLGFLRRVGAPKGYRSVGAFFEPGDDGTFGPSWAPRFEPTPLLLSMAEQCGVLPDAKDHFGRPARVLTRNGLIVLRAKASGFGANKVTGKRMVLPKDRHLDALRDEVSEMNAAIAQADVQGCPLPVLKRVFTLSIGEGNKPALHGRFYTPGKDGYVHAPKEDRKRITIGGEAIVEVDVSASQFWCFYGAAIRAGVDVDVPWSRKDLYDVSGLPRAVVKAFVATTWGIGRLPERWPQGTASRLAEEGVAIADHPIKVVREAVLQVHPVLDHLEHVLAMAPLEAFEGHSPSSLCSLWLMAIEAEALRQALLTLLRADGVVALPLHDALLVPSSKAEVAEERLRGAFHWVAGVKPRITVKRL